ncbi:hypothetical protein HDR58_11150 [bacterium]|nr:hypothetical protein [bacterium]
MKKKYLIIITIILAIILGSVAAWKYYTKQQTNQEEYSGPTFTDEEIENFKIDYLRVKDLPKDIRKTAKKFDLFNYIYSSDKPVLTYGWIKGEKRVPLTEAFHNEMVKELKKHDFSNYKIVDLNKPEREIQIAFKKNNIKIDQNKSCTEFTKEEKALDDLIYTTIDCYGNACIIDPKKNKYYILPKHAKAIVKILTIYK